MPDEIALATTRRKFYKALDAFTTSSQVSLAPSSTSASTPSKRPLNPREAFEEAIERTTKRLRHSTSSSSLPQRLNATPVAPSKKASPNNKSRDPPNYSPWSQETFLARLKTFSRVTLWHSKPDAINEVEWAKRGWVCVDVNTVACKGGCEKRVVVSLEPSKSTTTENGDEADADAADDDALEAALAVRYQKQIIQGHAMSCLWRGAGCKDDIYHLQVIRPAIWQPALTSRFSSTLALSSDIANLTLRTSPKTDPKVLPTSTLLTTLPSDLLPEASAHPAAEKALEISLHGWRGTTENRCALLVCDACFHRIGLWMYQPGYHSSRSTSSEEDENETTIDLVELHREHCPWRDAATQRAGGIMKGMNACQILLRVVSTFARDLKRRSGAQEEEVGQEELELPALSREEVARLDKEREGRLRRIKNLFSMRRKPKVASARS